MAGNSRSGRHPKPTAIKVLHGSKLRAGNRSEAKYQSGAPECPAHVQNDPRALQAWQVTSARLLQVGVLTTAHGESLATLCDAWADYVRCREQFAAMNYQQLVVDESIDRRNGNKLRKVKENPLIRRSEKLALLITRLLGEFGLTPITSPKVPALGQAASADPFTEFDLPYVN